MGKLWRRRPSPAMVVALLALVIALGGTAAGQLSRLVSGDRLIKKRSLSGNRLRNHTLTGKQINLSKLGVVPKAKLAAAAGVATSARSAAFATAAGSANSAGSANTAGFANTAGSAPPSGTAGGVLTGTYPSPTIAPGAVTAAMLAPSEPWHELGAAGEPTLQSQCTNRGGSWNTVAFYKDPLGIVHLKGQIAPIVAPTIPANTYAQILSTNGFFTLPAGYRPAAEENQAADSNWAGMNITTLVPLNVKPDGQVTSDRLIQLLNAQGNAQVVACGGTMSFDGVTFRAAG